MSANERQRQEAENAVNEIYKVLEGMGSGDVVKTLKALRAKDTAKWIESMANIQAQLAKQEQRPQPKPKPKREKDSESLQKNNSSIEERLSTAKDSNLTLKEEFQEKYRQVEGKVASNAESQFYKIRLRDRESTLNVISKIEVAKKLSIEEALDILGDYPQMIIELEKWSKGSLDEFYHDKTGKSLSDDLEHLKKKLRDAKVLIDLVDVGTFGKFKQSITLGIKSVFLTKSKKQRLIEQNRVIQSVTKLEGR